MTDKGSEFKYEAATLANLHLGEAKVSMDDEIVKDRGKRVLGTDRGAFTLRTYEVAQESMVDKLTGLLNRKGYEHEMNKFYDYYKRTRGSFWIAMLDLDNFKGINDTKGHVYGDNVLKSFGRSIQERFRKGDICGRYGGDEAIIMLTTGLLNPEDIDLEEKDISDQLANKIGTGVSIGIVKWDGRSTLEDTIQQADNKLYQNKKMRKIQE
jgi:diguanylate cyclase (GGDEF)-like protein